MHFGTWVWYLCFENLMKLGSLSPLQSVKWVLLLKELVTNQKATARL